MTNTVGDCYLNYKNLAEVPATVFFNKHSGGETDKLPPSPYDGGSNTSVNHTISANPVIVPIPQSETNKYNIGFDLNLVNANTIRINTVFTDGIRLNSNYQRLWDLRTSKTLVHPDYISKPYELSWCGATVPVFITSLTGNQEPGQGNIINCSVVFEVATQTVQTWL